MNTFITFLKKEFLEQVRSRRLMILGLLVIFFGILNPLTAKITPWLLEMLSESVQNSGISIELPEITALDSWVQFFKNIPMMLVIFVLMESNIFAKEYQRHTLTLVVTKGFKRYKIVLAKLLVLLSIWIVSYLLCFSITYIYNDYFWDNSIASNLEFAIFSWMIFGILIITIFTLFTTVVTNSGMALALTCGVIIVGYVAGALPKVGRFLPTILTDGNALIYGLEVTSYYLPGLIITIACIIVCVILSVLVFNKKKI